MNLPRCKTCKHWEPEDAAEFPEAMVGSGTCAKAPQIWDVAYPPYSRPEEVNERYVLRPEHAAILAVVEDGSAYSARLVTMPDFGCVQHELKESAHG